MKEHVAQRGHTWTYWIDVGRDGTGKRRRETKGGFKSEALARAAARRLLVQIEKDGGYQKLTQETVESFMRRWLSTVKSRTRASTLEMYRILVEKHIIPGLGDVPIAKLTVGQVNAFYGQVLESGRRDGRGGLSPRTVGHIHGCLRSALNAVVKEGLISRNVATLASPPRKQPKALNVWSAEEARSFLASVQHDRLFAAYALVLVTGLRRGELLGLAWRDIDLDAGWLHIRQTLAAVNYKTVQVSTPKTQSSRRSIALDPLTVEVMRDHRLRQLKERTLLGMVAQQPDDLVFAGIEGEPLHPLLFTHAFNRRVKESGVPRIRLHDCRHTAATLMLASGINPKVVAERLGHTSVSITLDLYSHSVPALQREAASKLATMVLGNPVNKSVNKPAREKTF